MAKITDTSKARQRHDLLGVLHFERALQDAAAAAFKAWLPKAEHAVFGSLTAAAAPDAQGVFAVAAAWREVLDANLLPVVEQLMLERMLEHMEATGVVGTLPPPPADAAAATGVARTAIYATVDANLAAVVYAAPGVRDWQQQHLANVTNRLVRVPDQVFDLVRTELDTSMALGEDPRQRALRVRQVLTYTDSEEWPNRAITIARTEATGAYNQASLNAAKVRGIQFDEPLRKVWMATVDSRTRDSHFRADGQVADIDGMFKVGRAQLEYPGDSSGPAGEIINCRCTMMELGPDDDMPDEIDRQTERGEGDATVRNREGTKQDEIDRRADDGVVRARDAKAPGDAILAAGQHKEFMMAQHWQGVLAPMGKPTGDGRMFAEDATVNFREFPLPLMWQKQTDIGHDQAYTVGSIRSAHVEGGNIVGEGVLFDTPEAIEAMAQIGEQVTRPSVDLCDDEWRMVDGDGNEIDEEAYWKAVEDGDEPELVMQFTAFTVMAATLVAKPAFAEAKLELTEEDTSAEQAGAEASLTKAEVGLVAAAAQSSITVYDPAMFTDPKLTGPTSLHMTEDGRIVGHLALWNDCHMGVGDACVVAPRSNTGYALFHVAEVQTDQGSLAVGKLTVGGGHASPKLGVQPTVDHYDNAGSAFALVRAGEDAHGIWVSGVPAAWATPEQVQLGLTCPLSGDWRRHGGNLELVAALSVNTPGFPVPRGKRNEKGQDYALVAAGALQPRKHSRDAHLLQAIDTAVRSAVQDAMDNMAERSTLQARQAEMAARVERIRSGRVDRELNAMAVQRANIIRNRTNRKA